MIFQPVSTSTLTLWSRLMQLESDLSLLSACLVLLSLGATGYVLLPAGRLSRRISQVRERTSIDPDRRAPRSSPTVRRQATRSIFGAITGSLAGIIPRATMLRAQLDRAGIKLSVVDFCALAGTCGLALGLACFLVFSTSVLTAAGVTLLASTAAPRLLLRQRSRRRARKFASGFPDAIDLIVRGVKSGLPVTESIQTAAREGQGIVTEVFDEITGGLQLGLTLEQALWSASSRLDIKEFKFFVISLSIQQETGGNLSEILQNLSTMMRRREQLILKIKALSSEAKASAMIVGSLPFIMFVLIYFLNPDYIMKFFIDPRGWLLLSGGLASLVLGAGVMAKMVKFEI